MDLKKTLTEKIDSIYESGNKVNPNTKGTDKNKVSKSLSWEVLSTYTYSKNKPKPVKYQAKRGITFSIQLGIFKGYLAPHRFNTVSPVIFDKFIAECR